MENEWPSHEQLRSVLVHFPAKFLLTLPYKVLHAFDDDLLQKRHSGEKGDWDFWISDLVKNRGITDI